MFRARSVLSSVLVAFLAAAGSSSQSAQKPGSAGASSAARNSIVLAESGHCAEALPSLRTYIRQISDKELKRKLGLDGVHCAMTLNQASVALEFLQPLTREFPRDPEVLYVAVHAYSDLSSLTSQELARSAPSSYQAHELLAESFETQGKWDSAEKEYRGILKQNPSLPGIHFRLGRMLLSKANSDATAGAEAKKEFQQELLIDPSNAGAEYVLGELARQNQQWDEAVNRFSRAAKLDSQFADAFFGLGVSLVAQKRYPDAITPLENAVRLEPQNPDAHYNLAMAYTRSGRKQDGEKEFAIHRQLIANQGGQSPTTTQPEEDK